MKYSLSRTGHSWEGLHPGTVHTNPTLLHTQTSWIWQDSLWLWIFCTGFLCTAFSAQPQFNFAIVQFKSHTLGQEKPIHGCHLPSTGQIATLCSSNDIETWPACFPHCFLVPYVLLRRDFIKILKAALQSDWQMTAQLGLFSGNVGKAKNASPWLHSHVAVLLLPPYPFTFLSTGMVPV